MTTQSVFSEKFLNQEINDQVKVLKLFIELPVDLNHLIFQLATSEAFSKVSLEKQGMAIAALLKATEEEKQERTLTGRQFCEITGFPACKNHVLCQRASSYCKKNNISRELKNGETYYPESVLLQVRNTI